MKNILVIAENSNVIDEVIKQVKLNVPLVKLLQINSSKYEAEITGADFKIKVVLKGKLIDVFVYDEVYQFTFNALLEIQLFGVVEAMTKELSPKEPTPTFSQLFSNIERENPVVIKKEFDVKAIPLQLLTKVKSETSNKEIDSILSTIRSIQHIGFYKTSDEGEELSRIEKLLEDKIITDMNDCNYKSLEHSVRLLKRVKDCYRTLVTSGVISGRTLSANDISNTSI